VAAKAIVSLAFYCTLRHTAAGSFMIATLRTPVPAPSGLTTVTSRRATAGTRLGGDVSLTRRAHRDAADAS